ncbi:MAG: CDP-alcohol phosphatidyltransferase family protein [Rhizobiaceae bacterium]
MIDGWARARIDPFVRKVAALLLPTGVAANTVSWAGLAIGLSAAFAIALGAYVAGLALLLASRLADALDGEIARARGKTDFGGFLDLTLDFAFYGAIPLGFAVADPRFALPAAALIAAFYVNGASFLGFALLAEKRGLTTDLRGDKSIYFTGGLAEAGETLIVFSLMCLAPAWFPVLAWGFAAICLLTALMRISAAQRAFAPHSGNGG